ncbi:hypothetical protein THAOC_17720, partial [Thalassiosira oceanica]
PSRRTGGEVDEKPGPLVGPPDEEREETRLVAPLRAPVSQGVTVHAVPPQHRREARRVGTRDDPVGHAGVAPPLVVLVVGGGEGGHEAQKELVGSAPDDVAQDVEAEGRVGPEPAGHLPVREDGRRQVTGPGGGRRGGTAGPTTPVLVVGAGVPAVLVPVGGLGRRRGRRGRAAAAGSVVAARGRRGGAVREGQRLHGAIPLSLPLNLSPLDFLLQNLAGSLFKTLSLSLGGHSILYGSNLYGWMTRTNLVL